MAGERSGQTDSQMDKWPVIKVQGLAGHNNTFANTQILEFMPVYTFSDVCLSPKFPDKLAQTENDI